RLQGASRRYIMSAVEASLKRLNTDYIDVYQQHIADPKTPIEETLRALDDLVQQGKVRYIGCSTLSAWQVVEAQWVSTHLGLQRYVSCQERYSLIDRDLDRGLMPVIESYGLGLIPFSPLADGLLTGKYRRNAPMPPDARLTTTPRAAERRLTDRNWAVVERLSDFCEARGHDLLELALSWLLHRPRVASVIAGATSAVQVEANVRAGSWALSRDAGALAEAKQKILGRGGKGKVLAISCDVSKAGPVEAACKQANSEFGKVDIFVNNAGQSIRGPSETITDEQWQGDLDLKLFAQIRFCRILMPQMKERKWGRIISVLNIGAKAPGADSAPTSVSRAAQMALTKAMSQEGAPHNVLCNSLHVGVIVSDQIKRRYDRERPHVSF